MIDLALPHDIDPSVVDLPGVTLVTLADLAERPPGVRGRAEVEAVRTIVTDEVEAFLSARRQAGLTPTVVALRTMATGVVDSEMARLDRRLPDLDAGTRAELLQTLRRVTDKLVHQPTIRAKELGDRNASSYAAALAELFALDPEAVDAMTRPVTPGDGTGLRGDEHDSADPARHPHVAPRHDPVPLGGRAAVRGPRPRGRAGRGDHYRRPQRHPARAARRHRRLRLRAPRGSARRTHRRRRPLAQGPAHRPAEGLALAAVPLREDPRDVVVARDGLTLGELPAGSRVGTGSPRRAAQLHALGLGLEIVDIRGNVDTRIRKVRDGDYDAVVLARAGLARIGRLEEATEVLEPLQMLPAPGRERSPSRHVTRTSPPRSPPWTTRAPAPPSPPNARCWPRSRVAAPLRWGHWPRWSRGSRTKNSG